MNKCASCGAVIEWRRTEGGKRMPIDVLPSSDGNVCLFECPETGTDMCRVLSAHELKDWNRELYGALTKSHFATCPNASKHRKPK